MAIKPVLKLHKKVGETPLECLENFRVQNPEYSNLPMTYAGRLDPMASGELLILVGDKCKNREKYLGLDKTYRVKILFGVTTDTYDILGLVSGKYVATENIKEKLTKILSKFTGKFLQDYPAFSSKTVGGKTLFSLAKSGALGDGDARPQKEVEIYKIKILGDEELSPAIVQEDIRKRINLVKGDFRQKEILEKWDNFFTENKIEKFETIEIEVHCSSGTYMRSLANTIGKKLGCGAIAWEIERLGFVI
jgi:tRNA pseudouridine55 synthase